MFSKEREAVNRMEQDDEKLLNLKRIHKQIEKKIGKLNKRKTLTPGEELEKKELQKEKLLIKDQMEALVRRISPKNPLLEKTRT